MPLTGGMTRIECAGRVPLSRTGGLDVSGGMAAPGGKGCQAGDMYLYSLRRSSGLGTRLWGEGTLYIGE